jgi:hypothetical protein
MRLRKLQRMGKFFSLDRPPVVGRLTGWGEFMVSVATPAGITIFAGSLALALVIGFNALINERC